MTAGSPGVQALLDAARRFAAVHGLTCEPMRISLFGFGDITTLLSTPEGGWWCPLHELEGPTGVDFADLYAEFLQEVDELSDDVGVVAWTSDGEPLEMQVVSHHFAMRVLAGLSPWRREFLTNTSALMRHAMLRSGLADHFTVVAQVAADGTLTAADRTFADVIAEDLPSEQEATAQAFAGPTTAAASTAAP